MSLVCTYTSENYNWEDTEYLEDITFNESAPPQWKRARHCQECGSKIARGSKGIGIAERWRNPTEWEMQKFGYQGDEVIEMTDQYLCPECADLYESVQEQGYSLWCILPRKKGTGTLKQDIKDYNNIYKEKKGCDE